MAANPRSLKERACAGELVTGAMAFECFTPGIAQIYKLGGCEFILSDMEHTGMGFETLRMLTATCRGIGIAPWVRVPRGEYHFLARALDCGAHGVMVPMVNSGAEARAIAQATHYPPRGRRGAAFGFTHDDYLMGDVVAAMKALDQRNVVIAQIETEHGLDAVDEIASTDGIDMLWVGHFDLTNFLRIPGQFEHPTYLEALDRIVAAGKRHKKGLAFLVTDPESARLHRKRGFNVIGAGTDHGLIMAGLKGILGGLER